MSNQLNKALPAPGPSPQQPIPELAQLANSLQAACEALHSLENRELPAHLHHEYGEMRCYYLAPSVVQHEKELLQKYRADDYYDLLAELHKLLHGVVKLMQSTHKDVRLRGYVLVSIGSLLEQVTGMVTRMMNLYARMERRTL